MVIQIGGPLIVDSGSHADHNKMNDDDGNSEADIISYLIGIVSFGPQVWLALNNYFIILLLNCSWCYQVLFYLFSGTRGFPGNELLL